MLIVEPGATRINVDQDPVGSSASYLVQCRLKGESIAEDARLTTQASDAEINISGQGIQIVRPQACNADGCSGPANSYAPVIINILGHAAVRVWHTDDTLEADWDQIPAIRVVEYRLITDHAEWKTSPVHNRARAIHIHRRPCLLCRRRPSHHPRLLQLQRRRRKARLAWPLPDQHI